MSEEIASGLAAEFRPGRFVLAFGTILLALFAAELLRPVQEALIAPWTALVARATASILHACDPDVVASGVTLVSAASGWGVAIRPGCNGVEACAVLAAAMLAYPAPWRRRLAGIAVGIAAVQAVNIVRIASLYYLGQWNETAFEWAHLYVWQPLIMLDALVVWWLWIRTVRHRAPKEARISL